MNNPRRSEVIGRSIEYAISRLMVLVCERLKDGVELYCDMVFYGRFPPLIGNNLYCTYSWQQIKKYLCRAMFAYAKFTRTKEVGCVRFSVNSLFYLKNLWMRQI